MKHHFDFIVIGSGPGGQKAAVCAAKAGKRVALVEQDRKLGGACVHYGTIPSKSLREVALHAHELDRAGVDTERRFENRGISELLGEVGSIVSRYSNTVETQMERNGVSRFHGRASFVQDRKIRVRHRSGATDILSADFVILATGSSPRHPGGLGVDHEHVLDGDSILKLAYLPKSLIVLGGGVIACEYASVFARLGVEVTIIDSNDRPLAFLDTDLTSAFLEAFESAGGRYCGSRDVAKVAFDRVSRVDVELGNGETISAEKVFVALGRSGCLDALDLESAGLVATARGAIEVDDHGATSVPNIYVVGDVAGPPALATSAMEQGRRAVMHALDLPIGRFGQIVPTGIYTIPELASVGATEAAVFESLGNVAVGQSYFGELARAEITGRREGFLKLVADPENRRLLGVHIVGEGATELIHVGQMALIAGASIDDLIANVFNFPTLTEAYRIAALDCLNRIDTSIKDAAADTSPGDAESD